MGTKASTNKQKGNYPYPTESFAGYPAPTDPTRPYPRPARLNQNAHPTLYRDPRAGELPPTENAIGGTVNPWLDTSPVPPPAPPLRGNVPSYQSPAPVINDVSPRHDQPPPYRLEPPAPIYQPVRQRPYYGYGRGLPNYESAYGPPLAPPPPRIQPYQQRPRIIKPYAVEPMRYRKVIVEPDDLIAVRAPKERPEEVVVLEPVEPVPVHDQDYEVESLLSNGLRPQDVVDGEASSKKEKDDNEYIGANLRFYRNETKFKPNGDYIQNVHKDWFGDYKKLENNHSYIQWLFPISERSRVNPDAEPLRNHEANHIKDDAVTKKRVVVSYRLMLDYFGFDLVDEQTGKLERSRRWKDRFFNLVKSYHNNYRITRIIRSLGELGFEHYQAPFVMALLHEVFETGELYGVHPVAIHHWIRTISLNFDRDYVYSLFKDKLINLEKDFREMKNKEAERYYYESFPKRQKRSFIEHKMPYKT